MCVQNGQCAIKSKHCAISIGVVKIIKYIDCKDIDCCFMWQNLSDIEYCDDRNIHLLEYVSVCLGIIALKSNKACDDCG